MDMTHPAATFGTGPLNTPLWFAQLLITFMFATGFISYYRRVWQLAFVLLADKPVMAWLVRALMIGASVGIGTGLHMVGWLVFTNATGLMFHNMGLFVLTFTLLDKGITWWEYGLRLLGIADVWAMHHMGYFDRPQFLLSVVGAGIGVGVLWHFREQIRYTVWRHIGVYTLIGVSFWTLLPPHSAGLVITPPIIVQGLSMYLVMVVVTAITLARDHQLEQRNQTNAQLAHYDSLTNAKSAAIYRRDVTRFFQAAHAGGHQLTVAAIDIDHFKQINDHYGHLVGDEVLIGVAKTIATELRRHQGQHSLYRTGGEEFSIVFVDVSHGDMQTIVTAVWAAVQKQHFEAGDYTVHATLSIGVAELQPSDQRFDDVYARADASLYQSKHNGRNAITIGDRTLNNHKKKHVMATRTLISQDVIDTQTAGKVVAKEVLVARYEYDHDRWNFPSRFMLPIDVQLNYIRDLLTIGDTDQIMLHLTQRQFEDVDTPERLLAFVQTQPQPVHLVVELDLSVQVRVLAAEAPRYRRNGIQIALVNVDARQPLAQLEPRLPYIDSLKVACNSLRKQYPVGLAQHDTHRWRDTVAPYHVSFIINEIENSVDADFAQRVLHARYLQGYYFDRPELPRLA